MPNKWSKEQKREYNKLHYLNNKKYHSDRRKKRRLEMYTWWAEYKSKLSCTRCKESHPACLDFHHLDSTKKDLSVSVGLFRDGWGKEKILNEIAKCIVLCSNCHRKEHYNSSMV